MRVRAGGLPFRKVALAAPLLVAAHSLFTVFLPAYWNTPPVYDLLYFTNYAPGAMIGVTYEIRDERLRLFYRGENTGFGWPRLFRLNPASGRYHEIPLPHMPEVTISDRTTTDPGRMYPLRIGELENLRVSAAQPAPDGYRFTPIREGKLDLAALFTAPHFPHLGYVEKPGARLPVRAPAGPRTRDAVTFVGWVMQ